MTNNLVVSAEFSLRKEFWTDREPVTIVGDFKVTKLERGEGKIGLDIGCSDGYAVFPSGRKVPLETFGESCAPSTEEVWVRTSLQYYLLLRSGLFPEEEIVEFKRGIYAPRKKLVPDYNGELHFAWAMGEATRFDNEEIVRALDAEIVEVDGVNRLKSECEPCEGCGGWKQKGGHCPHCEVQDLHGQWHDRVSCSAVRLDGHDTRVWIEDAELNALYENCPHCGRYYPKGTLSASAPFGLCPSCVESLLRAPILGYHDHNCYKKSFFGAPKERFKGLGFELEIDGNPDSKGEAMGDYNQEFARSLLDSLNLAKDEIWFERDGSLYNGGFEIISAPHTIKAFWNKQDEWAALLQMCWSAGYKSHDARCCGLHVHISREVFGSEKSRDANIAKIYKFYEGAWWELVKASRRKEFEYCDKNNLRRKTGGSPKYGEGVNVWKGAVKRNFGESAGNHHVALNNSNPNTFEFRLGRGTLNKMSFFAWIDLCWVISKNSKKSDKELNQETWVEWLRGIREQTAKYLLKRGAFRKEVFALFPHLEWEVERTDEQTA